MLNVTAGRNVIAGRNVTAARKILSTNPVVPLDFYMGMSTQIVMKAKKYLFVLVIRQHIETNCVKL